MKDQLNRIIGSIETSKLLVFGDFILDEFVFGEISRISREAPVLILRYQHTHHHPGGAANTVANVASLGAQVLPVGFLGDDEGADRILKMWPSSVDTSSVLRDGRFRTTRKSRILAGSFHSYQQQVVRMDHESRMKLTPEQERLLAGRMEQLMPECQGVVISDYSLGNVTPHLRAVAIQLARDLGLPLVVDSRDDPGGYAGATAVTPNITEVESALGLEIGTDLKQMAATCLPLLDQWQLQALLVTRGKMGMSLIWNDEVHHIQAFGSAEAIDVTGAGDTVAAAFASALCAGAQPREAALIANLAGGLVVMKKGTATVTAAELKQTVLELQ